MTKVFGSHQSNFASLKSGVNLKKVRNGEKVEKWFVLGKLKCILKMRRYEEKQQFKNRD